MLTGSVRDQVEALLTAYGDGPAPIVAVGDPFLRRPAPPYDGQLDGLLEDFVALLRRTMLAAPGVGLAAPQVGVPLRMAVLEDPAPVTEEVAEARERRPLEFLAVLNPRYQPAGAERRGFYEGCLSMPGYTAVVNRPRAVDAGYTDLTGTPRTLRLSGWQARIFQHETDHLGGIVYVDKAELRSLATTEKHARHWNLPTPAQAAEWLDFPLD